MLPLSSISGVWLKFGVYSVTAAGPEGQQGANDQSVPEELWAGTKQWK